MNRKWATLVIIVLQSVLLLTMIVQRQWTLDSGSRVLLETQPIDPRSLFRGDYVRLNYTISRIQLAEVDGDDEFKRHDAIYVVLEKGERYWQARSVHQQRPANSDDQVVLRGEVSYFSATRWDREQKKSIKSKNVTVRYGIENYFVPEGEGRKLERPAEDERIDIEVAIDSKGRAAISGLMFNDERLYEEGVF